MGALSPESNVQRWIRLNFWLSIWVAIAAVSARIARLDPRWVAAFPLSGRILAGALGFVAVATMSWFFVIRHGGKEARWAAGLLGIYFPILLLIQLAQASIGTPLRPALLGFCLWVALAHLAYAAFGSSAPA